MSIELGLINAMSSLQTTVSNYTDNNAVSIGQNAGKTNQGNGGVSVGISAGQTNQGNGGIAIGSYAGRTNQGNASIAIGELSAQNSQGVRAISLGLYSAQNYQGADSIAIGSSSGQTNQGTNTIAIGTYAGNTNQQTNTVAIGSYAGLTNQSSNAIAIGYEAGQTTQNASAVALGKNAGCMNQGSNSIAIGENAGYTNQGNNSIILNATGIELNSTTPGLFIKPIQSSDSERNFLLYDTTTSEITYNNTTKNFVINHPIDKDKYLVHACLEGPEAGIYYRGKGTIVNDESVQINLPEYVKYIGSNYSINITKIYSGKKTNETYETSEIENNSFTVYGKNGSFYWIVYAERLKIETEPDKKDVQLRGDGPYTYLIK